MEGRQVIGHSITPRQLELRIMADPRVQSFNSRFEVGSSSKTTPAHSEKLYCKQIEEPNATTHINPGNSLQDPLDIDDEDTIPISKLKFSQSNSATPQLSLSVKNKTPNAPASISKYAACKNSTRTDSASPKSTVEALHFQLTSLQEKLATTLHQSNHWKQLYEAEVQKSTKLQCDLKAEIDENASMEERLLILSLDKTELECGISP